MILTDETMSYSKKRQIANTAIANLLSLQAKLGELNKVESQYEAVKNRGFFGSDEEKIDSVRESICEMKGRPGCSFKCGPYALSTIDNIGKAVSSRHPVIEKFQTTREGTSLAELKALAAQMGMNYQVAKRSSGAPVVAPSVMHWKVGHFTALVGIVDSKYHVKDPTFDNDGDMMLSSHALEQERDGYFLIPSQKTLPSGWQAVSEAEAKTIKGKGVSTTRAGDTTRNDSPDQCPNPSSCKCPPGFGGMAQADAYSMLGTLRIRDIPLSYSPPVGSQQMDFEVTYNHEQTNQPSGNFGFSNFGYNWNLNWLSYLTVSGSNITVRFIGGGSLSYGLNSR